MKSFSETGVKLQLSDHASDCLMVILQLRQAGAQLGSYEELRGKMEHFLDKFERNAKRGGYSIEDIAMAKFALVAFIDETLISSDWIHKDEWLANPLQLQLYNRFDAGDEFFSKMEELKMRGARGAQILETYYLCLTLGFKGRYAFIEQEKLRLIIDETYRDIKRTRGRATFELSPNGKRKEMITDIIRTEVPMWIYVVGATALGFFFYMSVTIFSNFDARRAGSFIDGIF